MPALTREQTKDKAEGNERKRYGRLLREGGRKALSEALWHSTGYDVDAEGRTIMTHRDWVAAGRPSLLDYSPLETELVAQLNKK